MKLPSKFTALVCCIVLIVLAGAGTTLRGQTAGFAYVANCGAGGGCGGVGTGSVSAYMIDGTTGALMPVAGSPFLAGADPFAVTVDPTGQFLYVANFSSNNVSAYTIGAGGVLTPISGSPFMAGAGPTSLTTDPTGKFLYVANIASNTLSAYTIDGTTGALTPVAGSPFATGGRPYTVKVHPTSQFVYVVNDSTNDVSAYTIDGSTGALTPVTGSPFAAGSGPVSVTVDPTGQFAYVTNCGAGIFCNGVDQGSVSAYTIDMTTGALTTVAGSPFPAGASPFSVTLDPTGQFTYVAAFNSDNVSVYTVDMATGSLASVFGSPFGAGSRPASVTTTAGPQPPPATAAKN